MQEASNKTGSKEWLAISKDFVLEAYVEPTPLVLLGQEGVPKRKRPDNAVRKADRRKRPS